MKQKSKLGLGTLQGGDQSGFFSLELNTFKNIIRTSIKEGITTFDTAYSYTNAESVLSAVLKEQNITNPTIITKVMPLPTIEKKIESSLKRLNPFTTKSILLHWPTSNTKDLINSLDTLLKLKEEKTITSMGLSNFPLTLVEKVIKDYPIETLERGVSLIWSKELEDTSLFSKENNIELYGYSPLGMGVLTNKNIEGKRKDLYVFNYQTELTSLLNEIEKIALKHNTTPTTISLSWARSKGCDTIFFGASKVEQVKENLNFVELNEDEMKELDTLSSNLSYKKQE